LSNVWHMLAVSGYEDFGAMAKNAEAAATKALELDPGLAEAHSAMAGVHSMFDRFDAELVEAEAAVRINPNLSGAYMSLGMVDTIRHTLGDALPMFRRAYELDPLSPGPGEMLASTASWVGEDDEARGVLARLKEFNPKNPKIYLSIADFHMEKKDFGEAQRMVDVARGLSPDEPATALSQCLLFALEGKRKEAESLLEGILASENETFRLFAELLVHAALGDLDEAFRVLTRQAETHSWPFSIRFDPLFEQMRKDPRFPEFCRKVGIRP